MPNEKVCDACTKAVPSLSTDCKTKHDYELCNKVKECIANYEGEPCEIEELISIPWNSGYSLKSEISNILNNCINEDLKTMSPENVEQKICRYVNGLLGDVNKDCIVDIFDIVLCGARDSRCDWNGDGIVDNNEASIASDQFGKICQEEYFRADDPSYSPPSDLVKMLTSNYQFRGLTGENKGILFNDCGTKKIVEESPSQSNKITYYNYPEIFSGFVLFNYCKLKQGYHCCGGEVSLPPALWCQSPGWLSISCNRFDTPLATCPYCDNCGQYETPAECNNKPYCEWENPANCTICDDMNEEYLLCKKLKNCIFDYYGDKSYKEKHGCFLDEIAYNNGAYIDINALKNILNSCWDESLKVNVGNDVTKEMCYFNNKSISYYDFEKPDNFYLNYTLYGSSKTGYDYVLREDTIKFIPFYKVDSEAFEKYRIYASIRSSSNQKWKIYIGHWSWFGPIPREDYKCEIGTIITDSTGFGYGEFSDFSNCGSWKNNPENYVLNAVQFDSEPHESRYIGYAYAVFYANMPKSNNLWSDELRYSNCKFDTNIDPYLKERPWWASNSDNLNSSWTIVSGNPNSSIKVFYDSSMAGGEGILGIIRGDVTHDGIIDAADLVYCGDRSATTPASPNWDADCDMNNDNTIDVLDIVSISSLVGTTTLPNPERGNIKIQLGRLDTDFLRDCKFDIYVCSQDAFAEYEDENILTLSEFFMNFNSYNIYKDTSYVNKEIILYNYFEFNLDKEYTIDEIKSAIKTGVRLWETNSFLYDSLSSPIDWLRHNDDIYQGSWDYLDGITQYKSDCWSKGIESYMKDNNVKVISGNCQGGICKEKIKIRVAFKYIKPNLNNPLKSPLYPIITFCDPYSSIPLTCGDGDCDSGEDSINCLADCPLPLPPCSSYDIAGDCTGAGCKWCNQCSGPEVNQWKQDKCVDTATDCGYECIRGLCGAPADCGLGERWDQGTCSCVPSVGPCLEQGSLILTLDGFRPIEELNEGDYVIGYKNGEKVTAKITEKSVHEGEFKLYFYKDYWFTENHLVYLDNYEDFKPVTELSKVTKHYNGKIYNIQTETKNYFGEKGLLIHNK
jgi:hypothetical protein